MDAQQCKEETVINISSKELTDTQLSVLSKGLSFVPTSGVNVFGLKVDLFRCFRQIKLRHFFAKNTDPPTNATIPTTHFKKKSTFCPFVTNPSINTFCRIVEQDILQMHTKPDRSSHNLSKEERLALDTLANDKDIVIKPADKGGAIVIQDAMKYKSEICSQLSDTCFYRKLNTDPTTDFQKEIATFLETAKEREWITKSEFDFLYCQHPIRPVFYTLPKIHKCMSNPPGRPIVAQTDSLLSPLSAFVDFFIKPFVHALPAYIKDSTDFINKLSSVTDLPGDTFLLTLDVTSLYTNIPHSEGLEALNHFLLNRDQTINPPNKFIADLATFVMEYNYFCFDGDFYLQTSGVSMGTICAPNYANLFMGYFENNFVFNPEMNVYLPRILKYYRFIDDIFCIFQGNLDEVNAFVTLLNSFKRHLTFTCESSQERVHFLDMWVCINNGSLSTTLYRKDTDRNTLLLAKSAHPTTLKKGLPKSQFYRLRRICHTTEDYINKSADMKQRFIQRGYPSEWVETGFKAALRKPRLDLLKKSIKQDKKFSVTCITTYSPFSQQIRSVFKKHWHLLQSDPQLSHTFQYPPLFVNKRGRNIRDSLVKANFSSIKPAQPTQTLLSPIPNGNYPCGHCAQCNNTNKAKVFNHPLTGKPFPIKNVITCASTHVIYMLRCPCGLAYIGKTTRKLKTRISEHKSSIRRNDRDYPVAVHFNDMKHDISTLRFVGMEWVPPPPRGGNHDLLLKRREAHWIFTCDTLAPKGLNDELLLNVML